MDFLVKQNKHKFGDCQGPVKIIATPLIITETLSVTTMPARFMLFAANG
jgi:hypothetical protein